MIKMEKKKYNGMINHAWKEFEEARLKAEGQMLTMRHWFRKALRLDEPVEECKDPTNVNCDCELCLKVQREDEE